MPDISLPEVRLREKLPEGLRDMSMEDIQKSLPEIRLPKLDLNVDTRAAGQAVERAGKAAGRAGKAAEKAAGRAAKRADKTARDVQRSAAREAGRAAKAVEGALPRRAGPNPVPIAILAMLGGLVVGWLLATNPVTGPRISAWLDDARRRFDAWRGRGEDEWDTTEPEAFQESLRAPVQPEPYVSNLSDSQTGMGSGSGELPEGMGTSDPARVGADDGA